MEGTCSIQIVHTLGCFQRTHASGAVVACFKPLGARQGRGELRLRPFLCPFDRSRRWLALKPRAEGCRKNGPVTWEYGDARDHSDYHHGDHQNEIGAAAIIGAISHGDILYAQQRDRSPDRSLPRDLLMSPDLIIRLVAVSELFHL